VISLTARRLRQYPVEFGQTSTYVETARLPEVTAAAETFLRSIAHHGLIEIEFKLDERDGVLKLLDVNPRPWNWLGLAAAAGIDLGGAIAAMVSGQPVAPATARPGVAWIFASRDLFAAAASGRLRAQSIAGYAATCTRARSFACWSWTDPAPAIVDFPLSLVRAVRRRGRASAAHDAEGVTHART
jgi:predicted ATP-grasp superfamily ATP-dependent carboligase